MKTNKEILSSALRTVQMGQIGIRCVQDKAIDPKLSLALHDQLKEYDAIEQKAYDLASQRGWNVEPLDPAIERMASAMSRMRLMGGCRDSRIAGMLVQGNTKGMIKSLRDIHRCIGNDEQLNSLVQNLIDREKENIRQASEFL